MASRRSTAWSVAIAIGALLAAGCKPRFVPLEIDESWFACDADRDCTVLEDPRCTLMPISRRYARTFAEWVRLYRPSQVAADPCPRSRFRYEAVCESQRCSSSLVRSEAADVAKAKAR
jgi:hypothetical protein